MSPITRTVITVEPERNGPDYTGNVRVKVHAPGVEVQALTHLPEARVLWQRLGAVLKRIDANADPS